MVSRILFEGQEVYRLTCNDATEKLYWEILQFPAGKDSTVDFTTNSFTPKDGLYWFAGQSINACEAVEIYYPTLNVRDTLQLTRIEMEGE